MSTHVSIPATDEISITIPRAMQDAILLGAGRAMITGSHHVNAIRREGDDVILFYDALSDPQREKRRRPTRLARLLAWIAPRWFAMEAAP